MAQVEFNVPGPGTYLIEADPSLPPLSQPGTAADVLTGEQFYDEEGNLVTGTMPNNGAVQETLEAGGSYTIPAGYHNGSGTVTAPTVASETPGTAVAGDIRQGKTAWVDGEQLTGTVPDVEAATPTISVNAQTGLITAETQQGAGYVAQETKAASQQLQTQGAQTITPGTTAQTIQANVYLTGEQTIQGDTNLVPGNIKENVSIFGVTGTFEGGSGFAVPLTVTVDTGATVTAVNGDTTLTATSVNGQANFVLTSGGTWSLTATLEDRTASTSVEVQSAYSATIALPSEAQVYGVEWNGTRTTKWTRTDASAGFADPVPYVAGASSYSSPFDDIMPWAGMVRSTDPEAGEVVAIPKFWFKWTQLSSGLKLQIANGPTEDFYVSPAHADRGDGAGERDVVYIGRYHCASGYKSQTGVRPLASITQSTARSGIHNLGDTIWQSDMAMRQTIWMLYLVEFADWNSQNVIGYGCGNDSFPGNMGYTDSMPYHTGTTQSSRTTYGLGTQYRNIEGLWDNVYEWGDGCYYNSSGLNIITDPANFSDTSGGIAVGVPSNGLPTVFTVADEPGLEWCIYPTEVGGSTSTYSSDYWYFRASSPCLTFGGNYSQSEDFGLFCVSYGFSSSQSTAIGCRLMKLP